MASKADVLAWLDAKGYPHDTLSLGRARLDEARAALHVCGHRTRDGTPCAFPPMANGRCKRAGGRARRGIAHPQFIHGDRSKYIPKRLKAAHDKALRNVSGLLSLGQDLAVIEARIIDLFKRVDHGEAGALWAAAKREFDGLRRGLNAGPGHEAEIGRHLAALEDLLGRGAGDAEAWRELGEQMDRRTRMTVAERRGQAMGRDSLRIEMVMAFYRGLTFAVREAIEQADISDAARAFILGRVAERFSRSLADSGVATALPAGGEDA